MRTVPRNEKNPTRARAFRESATKIIAIDLDLEALWRAQVPKGSKFVAATLNFGV